ncbi:MAG: hypothetical protein A2583_05225 [Bdellovibrionales bacterium RIFOXYD1_FULL_53_11]|nr:MAG: hypothetical protein A2583_05225 [Bdellovibrionales bacterium RIFOXYD1_FULL_53_11]
MRTFAVVPTYNESANILRLLDSLLSLGIRGLCPLVVDDNSPDGTSHLVADYARAHDNVYLLQRMGDKGRGTAGVAGFDLALRLGADAIVEMDADFSHPPHVVPHLLSALEQADIAIASRLAFAALDGRASSRKVITALANRYARTFLEMSAHKSRVRDWTTGFRAYRRSVFEKVPPGTLISKGPSILQEILFRALNQGCTAVEIPFNMQDRAAGKSTFSRKIMKQSLLSIPCYRLLFQGGREFHVSASHTRSEDDRHFVIERRDWR